MADASPNILTLRINIHDKEKVKWIWEGMKHEWGKTDEAKAFIEKHGCTVTMVSWGDPYSEKNYILERIDQYLDRFDREDLLEGMGLEYDSLDEMGQLNELIEIWTKEAQELYGMDVTHEMVRERIQAKRAAKKQEQLELKEQPDVTK